MQADTHDSWKKEGELFRIYKPGENAEQSKSKEWWILVYLLQSGLDVVLFRKRSNNENEAKKGKRKWYTRVLGMGRKKDHVSAPPGERADGGRA
jgi:hypothetical protein